MSNILKKLLYVMIGLAILGVLISFGISQISPIKMLPKSFFISIEKANYDTAYFLMSTEFKKRNTIEDFKLILQETYLDTAKEWDIQPQSIKENKNNAHIKGFVTINEDGKNSRIPIEMQFVMEKNSYLDQGWKISGIKR